MVFQVAIRSESSGGWGVKNIIVDRLSPPEFNRYVYSLFSLPVARVCLDSKERGIAEGELS